MPVPASLPKGQSGGREEEKGMSLWGSGHQRLRAEQTHKLGLYPGRQGAVGR